MCGVILPYPDRMVEGQRGRRKKWVFQEFQSKKQRAKPQKKEEEEEGGLIGYHGEIGGCAETPLFLSPPSFFSLRLQWHQTTPLSNPGAFSLFLSPQFASISVLYVIFLAPMC